MFSNIDSRSIYVLNISVSLAQAGDFCGLSVNFHEAVIPWSNSFESLDVVSHFGSTVDLFF